MRAMTGRPFVGLRQGGRRSLLVVCLLGHYVCQLCFVTPRSPRAPSGPSVSLRAAKGVTPVVDDSDLSDSDSSDSGKSEPSEPESRKKASFDDILTEADNFATSIERKSKRSTAVARVSLEDELRGLSLEEDTDLDMMMMSRARGGKAKTTTLSYRINRWFEETKEMITNPTRIQITYAMVFFSCFASLMIMGVITFALGGVRLQGDGVESAMRQKMMSGDAFMQRFNMIRENKRKFAEMDDIRKYTSDLYTLNPDSKINFAPKQLAEITPEDVIGEF
ncbi:unnamed protein product [Symbiodinium sp. CCMP2592]|nr:unnamed protein product [Symbiodinium sp. CCMP2592]